MKDARTFATPDGESHFEEIDVAPEMVQVVPGRAAVESGAPIATSAARLMHIGADWDGSWHSTPKRWLAVTLAGDTEITIKRQMFGRAKFDLLRKRVLLACRRPSAGDHARRSEETLDGGRHVQRTDHCGKVSGSFDDH
jgi:hypothetical protein